MGGERAVCWHCSNLCSIDSILLLLSIALLTLTRSPIGSLAQRTGEVSIGRYKLGIGAPRRPGTARITSSSTVAEGSTGQFVQRQLAGAAVPEMSTDVYGIKVPSVSGQVWVRWTAPEDNNSSITSYQVTYKNTRTSPVSEATVTVTGNPARASLNVTGLSIGSGYIFYVRAVNAVGAGPSSEASDEVLLSPGRIRPSAVSLSILDAGGSGTMVLNFTCQHEIPLDGYIYLELPPTFTSVAASAIVTPSAGIVTNISTFVDGLALKMSLSGSTGGIPAETHISLAIDGVTNPAFEGTTDKFVALKTMESDGGTPIDEASADFNSDDQLGGITFIAGSFQVAPKVELGSYVAGARSTANISFTNSNPLPIAGHIVIEFPPNFTSIEGTAVEASGMDGGFTMSIGGGGYTVDVQRDATGTEVAVGTAVTVKLVDAVTNQHFEGRSSAFPLVKTTLANSNVSIDETSVDVHKDDRPAAVLFTPAPFAVLPTVTLGTTAAGVTGSATVNFTSANPLPNDGNIVIEFPYNFTSIETTAATSTMDGGFIVSLINDGYTVVVTRDGYGTEVALGTPVSLRLEDGIKNQRFEGPSTAFPSFKTTLADTSVSINEASSNVYDGDSPSAVLFTPGSFMVPPVVELASYDAGVEGAARVSFTMSNPLPLDGHIVIEFPSNFKSIATTAVNASGIDGGFVVSVGADGFTVDIERDGTGLHVLADTAAVIDSLDGITNQRYEGRSVVFPSLRTTLADTRLSIDEASVEVHADDRPAAVLFAPGAFARPPGVKLASYDAGAENAANISFVISTPLPIDGHIVVEFPTNFTSITTTTARASGSDGGLIVSVGPDGNTIDIQRDGNGTEVPAGRFVSVQLLDGIINQQYEGESTAFPLVKTTLADTDVSIDEASSEVHSRDRPAAVLFTPAAFVVPPTVTLDRYDAGVLGAAHISFTTSNPLPIDGHVVLRFPKNVAAISSEAASATGIDGGFVVSVDADGLTVDIERDGTGTQLAAGTPVSIRLIDGVTNQQFEGESTAFPLVKTTLADTETSIDEASSDVNTHNRAAAVMFTPAAFAVPPAVTLDSYDAGVRGAANISFTTSNPIPTDGHIVIEFPSEFTSIDSSGATAINMDGGLVVHIGDNKCRVDIKRDGTGTAVPAGTAVSVRLLDGVTNQKYEGASAVFPLVKTALADPDVSIDEASSDVNSEDRPTAIMFTPARFAVGPTVRLDSYVAGVEGAANISLTTSNPLPVDGQIVIKFPDNFMSIDSQLVDGSGIDGGLAVSVGRDGYTVAIKRDGSGSVVPAGTAVSVRLMDGISNQHFEGESDSFPLVKTTLADSNVSIDDSTSGSGLSSIFFRAASFPFLEITLQYDVAGMHTSTDVSFITANPLPRLAVVYVEFPPDFVAVSPTLAESVALGSLSVSGSYSLKVRRDGSAGVVPSGTIITLTLANVITRDTAGDTGNFHVATFTEESMSKRIDAGVASSVKVGKQILKVSAEYGSSHVAVVAQEKRWTFVGYGVALGDQLKWVNSSATSDAHCDWESTGIEVDTFDGGNSTAAKITFSDSSDGIGPLQMCYRFASGDNPFKLYREVTLNIYKLHGIPAAEEGSTSVSVAGYSKVLTVSGFGVARYDEARWLLGGASNCTSAVGVASLTSGGDNGENSAVVSSSNQASFEFAPDIFERDVITGNVGATATLCYKFGSERFQHYPTASMQIRHITGWTSSVGGSSVAVVGVMESLTFTGYGVSAGTHAGDRARWILSGSDCYNNSAENSDAASDLVSVTNGQAAFTFQPSASGSSPRLCYRFEEEPAMTYPSLTIDVAYLSAVSAPSFGDTDVAVVGHTKSWGFGGGHIEDGDMVRWIYNDSSDCSDLSSVAEMVEDGGVIAGQTECTFSAASSGSWITPCYRHSNEPWRRYSMPVYVKMVHNMIAAWGNDAACVAEQPKRWSFVGDGLTPDGATDLIKFVGVEVDCESGFDITLSGADSSGIAMYLAAEGHATFTIDPEAAGKSIFLCYQFGTENYHWYNMSAYVHMLQSVGSRVGGNDIAVVDVLETFVLHANGTSSRDRLRWVVSDDTMSDSTCTDNNTIIDVWDSVDPEGVPISESSVDVGAGVFLANFTFDSSSAGLSPMLCYKFGDELWKLYADKTVDVAMLQAVHANEGSSSVAVVDYSKMWSLNGMVLAPGDQIFWSGSTCKIERAANLVGDSDGVLQVDSTFAPWFTFDSTESGSILHVCYKFNGESHFKFVKRRFSDEPFKMYEEFEIDIRMIRAVAVDIGSSWKAVPDVAKTFSFIGDGTASEAGIDSIKWIKGSDCASTGIRADVGDIRGRREVHLAFFASTGFTAQTMSLPKSEIGGPYSLCLLDNYGKRATRVPAFEPWTDSFDLEPYQLYSSLLVTVLGITEVTAEKGADNIIVVGAIKRFKFTGGGAIEAGDRAVWLSGAKVDSDCLVDSFLDGPQSTVGASLVADFFIKDEDSVIMAGRIWTLCYQFGTESFKIYPSFLLEAVTLSSFSAASGSDDDSVVGYPKIFHPEGPGVLAGDQAKWVGASVISDADCDSERLADASMVVSAEHPILVESDAKELMLQASFILTSPTIGGTKLRLCYKHQIEPYHLHAHMMLGARQLVSASVRALGVSKSLSSITNAPQPISFVAYGGMAGDRYKWVSSAGNGLSGSKILDSCKDEVEPAAGSSVGVTAGFYQEGDFTFTEAASALILCYGPGAEPYMVYPTVNMEVYSPSITSANRTHVLVGRPTNVRLVGTFGITAGDALKLVGNADGDCGGDAAGGDKAVFHPYATTRGRTEADTGTSDIVLLVSDRTEENRPFKLCYRFGAEGVWEMFDTVSFEAFEVTSVYVDIGDGSPAAGDLLDFSFIGTGVVDRDQAKWIDGSVSSDDECEGASTTADSRVEYISDGVAQFAFEGEVEYWNLCYKHGSDDWRFYGAITPTTTTSRVPDETTSDTQLTKALVSLTLEGSLNSYPAGSTARTDFEAAFSTDLASALGEDQSRFQVEEIRAGSIIVDFSIGPTGSLADASVIEILANLDAQIADASSPLRNGNVTSAAMRLAYTTSVLREGALTDSVSTSGLSIVEYQPKGLFGFTSSALYTTEASGAVTLTVGRNHGTKGIIDIGYATSDGSAASGSDYVTSTGVTRFFDEDTAKTFDVVLLDNNNAERHFKAFQVALSILGPVNEGAALRASASLATVYVYDYGDGIILANTSFPAVTLDAVSQFDGFSPENATNRRADGWTVKDNGGETGWVDSVGFAAKDAVVGGKEYDDRCDYAATSPCDHDCPFGGGLAELFPTTGESPSVLRLDGTGFVATVAEVTDFPTFAISISVWVRASSSSGGNGGGALLSYASPDSTPGDAEILLHDLCGLRLLVHGTYVIASHRYDDPGAGDLSGIRTGINVARDGAWHHVAVAWRSVDGKVDAFLDGARVFDGGPYKTGAHLTAGGRVMLGQSPASECLLSEAGMEAGSTSTATACYALAGGGGLGGLEADVQHLRIWSKYVTADEVAQQMQEPFEGNSVRQILHWNFTPAMMEGRIVRDASGIGESTAGVANDALLSEHGSSLVQASPSLNPGYPCGSVYSGVWRFAAPDHYVAALRNPLAYGGRLHFRLAYTIANGDIRSTRGAVTIRSREGMEASWDDLFGLAESAPGEWTHVSVVLREDHGWRDEPLGNAFTAAAMQALLADASELLIRGDMRVFGKEGGGTEVVYLQDVQLLATA